MRHALRLTSLGLAGLLALASSGTGCAQSASGSFRQTLRVGSPLELDVTTGSGSVTVRAGAAGQAEIAGRIRVGRDFSRSAAEAEDLVHRLEADPPIELMGNELTIGRLDEPEYRHNVSISYEITVPAATSVKSRTGSGGQTLSGIEGPVEASTGSGEIALNDISGAVDVRTGSGSIRAERIAGAFDGSTGSGSVELEQTASGDVTVSTGSGTADLRGIDGAVRVRTGSGSVRVAGRLGGSWDLETGSGSIRVGVPDDAAFELDARTQSGSVSTSRPITVQGTIERGRLHGSVGGGGPLLRLRTGSGDIRIE